jgi:hypothetical protein
MIILKIGLQNQMNNVYLFRTLLENIMAGDANFSPAICIAKMTDI